MTTTVAGFAAQSARFSRRLPAVTETATKAVGTQAKRDILAAYARAGYGSMFLRNAGRRGTGVRMGVSWSAKKLQDDSSLLVRYNGPAFVDLGSVRKPQGWDVTPRKVGKRAKANAAKRGQQMEARKALTTPFGFRTKVHMKPSKGVHAFREGSQRAQAAAPATYQRAIAAEMAKVFR